MANEKILAGRKAVDAYREAHRQLYTRGWYKGISEDHMPLLKKLVAALEKLGFTSAETEFEPKKDEILAKLWAESDALNVQELGLEGKEMTKADREALGLKWS
ncbi:unnamed protein product [marine sediment metagenome]|uniref:Uncharacterized protein n=1 Tax=marine sediment metagenome TaxID=412755 RepID=X1AVQ8_9ZZZZ